MKRLIRKSIIFLSASIFMSTTCEKPAPDLGHDCETVTLCNHSDETIYWSGLDFDGSGNEDMTVYQALKESSLGLLKLQPKEEIRTHFTSYNGHPYQLMVFKQSTLDKYRPDQLIEQNLYDKLFKFDWEELFCKKRSIIVFED